MKLNFGKRLVLFLHWLLSVAVCALAVIACVWPETLNRIASGVNGLVGAANAGIISIAGLAVYVVFVIASVIIIFSGERKKKSERGFIVVDSNEGGKIRIAVGAVEQMIRQAAHSVNGIGDMKCGIINNDDAVSINTTVTVLNGAHVPTVTMNIQRAIRSYIELNCGIAVREVSVSVQSLDSGENARGKKKGFADMPVAPVVPTVVPVPAEEPAAEIPVGEEPVEMHIEPVVEEPAAQEEPVAETPAVEE